MKCKYDDDFEGMRLVDNVKLLEKVSAKKRKIIVYSPKLRANILVYKNRLICEKHSRNAKATQRTFIKWYGD